jgi:type II secretory pathway pseudopilin PulG
MDRSLTRYLYEENNKTVIQNKKVKTLGSPLTLFLKKGEGFTLVETIIYLGIVGLIMVSLTAFSLTVSSTRERSYVVSEVQGNARMAMDTISSVLNSSNSIDLTASIFDDDDGDITTNHLIASINPTRLFKDVEGRIILERGGTPTSDFVTSPQVEVTQMRFTNVSGIVRISLTLRYNGGYDYEYSIMGSAGPRI